MSIGSVSCERSFSDVGASKAMEQNNNGRGHTKGLALLHVRDVNVDRVKLLDKFDTGNSRIGTLHL